MTIHEDNYIEELKKHNEKALCYVIDPILKCAP